MVVAGTGWHCPSYSIEPVGDGDRLSAGECTAARQSADGARGAAARETSLPWACTRLDPTASSHDRTCAGLRVRRPLDPHHGVELATLAQELQRLFEWRCAPH